MNSTTAPLWCKEPKFEISKDAQIDIPAFGGRMDVKWEPETHNFCVNGGIVVHNCCYAQEPNIKASARRRFTPMPMAMSRRR